MGKLSRDRVEVSTTAGGPRLNIGPKWKAGRWSLLWAPLAFAFRIYGIYGVRLFRGRLAGSGNIAFGAWGRRYRFFEEEVREAAGRTRIYLPNVRSHS